MVIQRLEHAGGVDTKRVKNACSACVLHRVCVESAVGFGVCVCGRCVCVGGGVGGGGGGGGWGGGGVYS